MKATTTSRICLPVAAMILTAGFAVPAAEQNRVPFKGTLQGNDSDTCFSFPIACVATKGTGIASHLGQFSFTIDNAVNVTNGTDQGTTTLTATNGDSITATFTGSGEPTADPNVFSITEVYTITGGTGRFAGAQGSFILERLASGATFLTSGSFHGTITAPRGNH